MCAVPHAFPNGRLSKAQEPSGGLDVSSRPDAGLRLCVCTTPAASQADIYFEDSDDIRAGSLRLTVMATPGHTSGCVSFYTTANRGMIFTGDTLLIRGCGRTDFQEGDSALLYKSVHERIFTLPQHTKVFPAHDYKGCMQSTVAEEIAFNPRLSKPLEEFKSIMDNLNLPYPKKIDEALPANLVCGLQD
mmetsp:Transcript_24866/g.69303  ORF Transcript_24866/g.69303 Transcript_24866/m.69303 type:complete len:189 (-) Transcript_24866:810-1376(-)